MCVITRYDYNPNAPLHLTPSSSSSTTDLPVPTPARHDRCHRNSNIVQYLLGTGKRYNARKRKHPFYCAIVPHRRLAPLFQYRDFYFKGLYIVIT